jgi:hypothetical protein
MIQVNQWNLVKNNKDSKWKKILVYKICTFYTQKKNWLTNQQSSCNSVKKKKKVVAIIIIR